MATETSSALDYPYIRAWGRMLGSFDYYIQGELAAARADGAPPDACYRESTVAGDPGRPNVWRTFGGVTNRVTRERIVAIVAAIRAAGEPVRGEHCGHVSGQHVCTKPAGHTSVHAQYRDEDGQVVALWSYGPQGTPEPVIGPKRLCGVCGRAHK